MSIENPFENSTQNETSEYEISPEINPIDTIKKRAETINNLKLRIVDLQKQIELWGESSPQDHTDINNYSLRIEEEKKLAMNEIKISFDLLREEVMKEKEIKSESGTIYKPQDIANNINKVRDDIISGGSPDLRLITRALNLRPRISEIVDLFLQINK